MNSERIKLLEQYLEDDPTDPFNLYALALEYQKQNPSKAASLFELLLARHPDYLPTYYIAGNFYADQAQNEKALEILRRGMALAKSKGENNTTSELQSAIDLLDD
jgi:tetratricopeptide (TPR) repeat protein